MGAILGLLFLVAQGPDAELTAQLEAARALVDQGHPKEALKAFEKANGSQRGQCVPCYVGMAKAQLALDKPEAAAKSCEKALALPSDPPLRARIHAYRGLALMRGKAKNGQRDAETAFRSALEADPSYSNARFNLGYVLLKLSRDSEGIAELTRYLEEEPAGTATKKAREFIENPRRAREFFVPEFRIHTLDGAKLSLASFRGKVVVLDFWATWCGPCRQAIPELKALVRKYPSERFVLVSVSADRDEGRLRNFVRDEKMDWTQCWDGDGAVARQLGVNAYPTYLVIDGDGALHLAIVGSDPRRSVASRLSDTLKALPELQP